MKKGLAIWLILLIGIGGSACAVSGNDKTLEQTSRRLIAEMQRLSIDSSYLDSAGILEMSEGIRNIISDFSQQTYDNPLAIVKYSFTEESFIEAEGDNRDRLIFNLKRNVPVTILNSYGPNYLAAMSVLTRDYAMARPADFESDCFLLMIYEAYCAWVMFLADEDDSVLVSPGFFPNSEGLNAETYRKDFEGLFPTNLALDTQVIFRAET